MSVGKILSFTRRLSTFPRSITSFFDSSRNNGEKNPNFLQRNFSSEESENLLSSLKSFSKRVRFYDRSEQEAEIDTA
jgi:hypothetical protein